ncbi:MAG: TetR/AcrR family transcriptional regulator [Novosphingobium sp.]|nr:TetR/AcrR family transcriptional regulator [Novosphingobium sp.]
MATTAKSRKDKENAAPTRRRRTYLPAAERRKQIIAAAQQVFAHANLKGARTRDIAKAAEVNQATIFEHFESKEALFQEAVVQPLIDAMRGMHERVEVYETADTPAQMAKLAVGSTTRHLEDMDAIFPLLAAALFSDPDLGRQLYREQIAPLVRQRGEVLRPLVKDGIDPEFVGLANFGMLLAVAMDRYFGEGNADLSELAKQFNRLSTSGFAREKKTIATRERDDDGTAT